MIPNHILNEIAYRLRDQADDAPTELEELASAVGIDLDAARTPLPTAEEAAPHSPRLGFFASESEPFRGAIPFELNLEALGVATTCHCRATYEMTMMDDLEPVTDEPARIMASITVGFQVLNWLDPDNFEKETGRHLRLPAPRWEDAELYNLLPEQVLEHLDDLIEAEVRAAEIRAREGV